jgi:leader peptidase (prepilin peptidase) / N-methyltransferase
LAPPVTAFHVKDERGEKMVQTPWGLLPWWLLYVPIGLFGLAMGSFANVLIYRLPRDESIISPGSRCPKCGHTLKPWENIPLASWVILRGRCRECKEAISIRYPLVELFSCALVLFSFAYFGIGYAGFAYGMLFVALFALVIIDLEHWLLPFAITVPVTIIGVLGSIWFELHSLADSLLGMLAGFALFMVIMLGGKLLFKREAMGGGDVVFGIMAGVFLGWKLTILMVFVASLLGTLMAIPLLFSGRDLSGRAVPFGPFLAAATLICVFVGDDIVRWYSKLIGL